MRIALVIHGFPPANMAGSEVYTRNLAVELSTRHEVFVFHRTADPEEAEYAVAKSRQMGLDITAINNNFKNCPDFSRTYRNDEIAEKFGEFLDEVSPQVVHFHHLTCLSTTCVEEAKKRGIPVVYTLHDFWLLCQRGQLLDRELTLCKGPSPDACALCLASQIAMGGRAKKAASALKKGIPSLKGSSRAKELLRKAFLFSSKVLQKDDDKPANEIQKRTEHIRNVCSLIDRFVSPSMFMKEKFVAFGIPEDKIAYLDNGFDKTIFKGLKRKPSKKIRFGYVGSWIPSKGVHVLIKAFNRVTDDKATLTIYGRYCAYDGYKDYDKDLEGLIDNKSIKLAGSYDNKDVGKILSGMDALIVPSIWYENSPLTVHEAYLAGVPVIASDIGGLAEYVHEGAGGMNFRAGDEADLYRKIKEIIDNPGLLEKMRHTIPAVKSIAENAGELEEIYAELTAPSIPAGYDFVRNIFSAEVKKEGKGFSECAYPKYRHKEMVNVSAFKVAGEERRVLFEHPAIRVGDTSMTVSFRRIAVKKGDALEFGLGINEEAWEKPGDGVEFELLVEQGKVLTSIFKRYIDPKENTQERKWFDERVPLTAFEGKTIALLFRTSAGPRGDTEYDWAGWSEPAIVNEEGAIQGLLDEINRAFIVRYEVKEETTLEDVLYLGDDARQVVSLENGSELIYRGVAVPAGARLTMGMGGRSGPTGMSLKGGLDIDVAVEGKRVNIFSKNALAVLSKRLTKSAWHDVDIDLGKYGGQTLDFHFSNKSSQIMGLGPLEITSAAKKRIKRKSISHTNVLIITLDAVRADRMGFMGSKTVKTPCMDRLAREGAVFKRHFAQSHITIPSHMSLLSSKYPRTIKTLDNYQYNLPPLDTIAERLGREGFQSSAVVSVSLLNPNWCRGIERGFSAFFPVLGRERTASQGLNILGDWIRENSEKPFFSWIHLYDAHFPYQAPKPFHKMYSPAKGSGDAASIEDIKMHPQTKKWLTSRGISSIGVPVAEYGAEITYLDHELDRLFRGMEALGIMDNTLVMITADHGECLGDRDSFFSHVGVYNETMHIPLVMRLPGRISGGNVIDAMTMNVDLAPTALDILGLPVEGMEGKSLLPLMDGTKKEVHEYVIDEGGHGSQVAIRTGKWKFIKTLDDISYLANFQMTKGTVELYDLDSDPAEQKNVAADNPQVSARFEKMLSEWLAERAGGEKAEQIAADEDTKKKLEALGYL